MCVGVPRSSCCRVALCWPSRLLPLGRANCKAPTTRPAAISNGLSIAGLFTPNNNHWGLKDGIQALFIYSRAWRSCTTSWARCVGMGLHLLLKHTEARNNPDGCHTIVGDSRSSSITVAHTQDAREWRVSSPKIVQWQSMGHLWCLRIILGTFYTMHWPSFLTFQMTNKSRNVYYMWEHFCSSSTSSNILMSFTVITCWTIKKASGEK